MSDTEILPLWVNQTRCAVRRRLICLQPLSFNTCLIRLSWLAKREEVITQPEANCPISEGTTVYLYIKSTFGGMQKKWPSIYFKGPKPSVNHIQAKACLFSTLPHWWLCIVVAGTAKFEYFCKTHFITYSLPYKTFQSLHEKEREWGGSLTSGHSGVTLIRSKVYPEGVSGGAVVSEPHSSNKVPCLIPAGAFLCGVCAYLVALTRRWDCEPVVQVEAGSEDGWKYLVRFKTRSLLGSWSAAFSFRTIIWKRECK